MLYTSDLPSDPRQNKLLAALPAADWGRLRRHLEPVEMMLGDAVREAGAQLTYAYFPTTSVISLLYATSDGVSTEIATVGNEGLVGVTLLLGDGAAPTRAVVQTTGWAYRINGDVLKQEFLLGGAIQALLLRYTQALFTLVGQTAVCNRRHSIDQQLCRWLLFNLDRLTSMELVMTHEMLANMLGVRREGITEAAHKLRIAGLISYHRGRITVLNRSGVEKSSCECYEIVRREYKRLLGGGPSSMDTQWHSGERTNEYAPRSDQHGARVDVRTRRVGTTPITRLRSGRLRPIVATH